MLTLVVFAGLLASVDPDGVVATAPQGADSVVVGAVAPTTDAKPDVSQIAPTPQSLTTAQQIDRWLGARSSSQEPFAEDDSPIDDRKMHGFVSGAIGTGDYNAFAVGVSVPLGETGRVDLTYSQSQNDYGRYGYGYGYPGYGYGYGYDRYATSDFGYPAYGYGRRGDIGMSGRSRSFSLSYQSSADERDRPFPDR